MKVKYSAFSLIIAGVLTLSSWAWSDSGKEGGSGVGKGGDAKIEQRFAETIHLVWKFLNQEASKGHYDYVEKEDIEEMRAKLFPGGKTSPIQYSSDRRLFLKRGETGWHTPISEKEYDRLRSDPETQDQVKEVGAINYYPDRLEIRVSVSRWEKMDSAEQMGLALHEILGLIGKDEKYEISPKFTAALRGKASSGDLLGWNDIRPPSTYPPGVNGMVRWIQAGLAGRNLRKWIHWNEFRSMEPEYSDQSIILLFKMALKFTLQSMGEKARAEILMRPIVESQFSTHYSLVGQKLKLPDSGGEWAYYFKGDLREASTFFDIPNKSIVTQERFQRTDFFYHPSLRLLVVNWYLCREREDSSCYPTTLNTVNIGEKRAADEVPVAAAAFRID